MSNIHWSKVCKLVPCVLYGLYIDVYPIIHGEYLTNHNWRQIFKQTKPTSKTRNREDITISELIEDGGVEDVIVICDDRSDLEPQFELRAKDAPLPLARMYFFSFCARWRK